MKENHIIEHIYKCLSDMTTEIKDLKKLVEKLAKVEERLGHMQTRQERIDERNERLQTRLIDLEKTSGRRGIVYDIIDKFIWIVIGGGVAWFYHKMK